MRAERGAGGALQPVARLCPQPAFEQPDVAAVDQQAVAETCWNHLPNQSACLRMSGKRSQCAIRIRPLPVAHINRPDQPPLRRDAYPAFGCKSVVDRRLAQGAAAGPQAGPPIPPADVLVRRMRPSRLVVPRPAHLVSTTGKGPLRPGDCHGDDAAACGDRPLASRRPQDVEFTSTHSCSLCGELRT